MREICLFIVILLIAILTNAQDTIIFKPGPTDGKDARLNQHQANQNLGDADDFISYYWTFSGEEAKGVSLIQFDLSSIPDNVFIIDARLNLYYNSFSNSAGHFGENESCLKRITETWDENTVTWNTMPAFDSNDCLYLETSTSENQNYLNLNITDFVEFWYEQPENNHGLILENINDQLYTSIKFASSDCFEESIRPMLMIVYTENQPQTNCITLQPGPEDSYDARLHGYYPNTNFGDTDEFLSYYWTFNGSAAPGYSVIKFDLDQIPDNVIIQSANLSLFHINSPSAGQNGNNECYLRKITENWDEHSVTWNNMPSITNQDEVFLPHSIYSNQNYENIDVTNFVSDWYNNPENNFGIMLQINEFELYRSMKFASGDCIDPTLRPKLEVCYDVINENELVNNDSFSIFPNPTDGLLFLQSNNQKKFLAQIYNLQSEIVFLENFNTTNNIIDLTYLPVGVYFIKITFNESTIIRKFVKN